jgi:GH24 family phage-related lysozyme (muramidase)
MAHDLAALDAELQEDEGNRPDPYDDATGETLRPGYTLRGNVTISVGVNLSVGLTPTENSYLAASRRDAAAAQVAQLWPWSASLPDPQWRVLVNLCFNLGADKLAGFVHFLADMRAHDWNAAANELQHSTWWGEVGARGPRMVARLIGAGT